MAYEVKIDCEITSLLNSTNVSLRDFLYPLTRPNPTGKTINVIPVWQGYTIDGYSSFNEYLDHERNSSAYHRNLVTKVVYDEETNTLTYHYKPN